MNSHMRDSITLGGYFYLGAHILGLIESALKAVWFEVGPKEKLKVNELKFESRSQKKNHRINTSTWNVEDKSIN